MTWRRRHYAAEGEQDVQLCLSKRLFTWNAALNYSSQHATQHFVTQRRHGLILQPSVKLYGLHRECLSSPFGKPATFSAELGCTVLIFKIYSIFGTRTIYISIEAWMSRPHIRESGPQMVWINYRVDSKRIQVSSGPTTDTTGEHLRGQSQSIVHAVRRNLRTPSDAKSTTAMNDDRETNRRFSKYLLSVTYAHTCIDDWPYYSLRTIPYSPRRALDASMLLGRQNMRTVINLGLAFAARTARKQIDISICSLGLGLLHYLSLTFLISSITAKISRVLVCWGWWNHFRDHF